MDRDFSNIPHSDYTPPTGGPVPQASGRPDWQREAVADAYGTAQETTASPQPQQQPYVGPQAAYDFATPPPAPALVSSPAQDSSAPAPAYQPAVSQAGWSADAQPVSPAQPPVYGATAASMTDHGFGQSKQSWRPSIKSKPWSNQTLATPPNGYSSDTMPADIPSQPVEPQAVVEVVSPRGVEYAMMTLTLWIGALALLALLLTGINVGANFEALGFPLAVLIISLPVFSWFFLRLKQAELTQPALKLDPSKRRFTQFTQVAAFGTCLLTLIAFVYFLMLKVSGSADVSLFKAILDVVAILAVAGGILAYYWNDERQGK